jgi:glycosyltransferase involved in cell wall biosynthesis
VKVAFLHPAQGFGQQIRAQAVHSYISTRSTLSEHAVNSIRLPWLARVKNKFGLMTPEKACSTLLLTAKVQANIISRQLKNYDLVHAENHEGALVAVAIEQATGLPFIFDMHGLAVEEARGRGESKIRIQMIAQWEALITRRARWILVVSELMADYVTTNYQVPREHILVVPCGANEHQQKAKWSPQFKAVYAGGSGYYERVEDYFSLPQSYKNRHSETTNTLKFCHIGHIPPHNDRFVNINFLGRQSRENTLALLSTMQVGIAPSTVDLTRRCASPVKVVDYASCGLPIICPDVGAWSKSVSDFGAGIVCTASDPDQFADAISKLRDKDIWEKFSAGALSMIRQKYSWPLVLKPLEKIYG